MLLFIADNLAYFPYQTQEEPLFIMHHIDITLSVSGSNLLQSFKEVSSCFCLSVCIFVPFFLFLVYANFFLFLVSTKRLKAEGKEEEKEGAGEEIWLRGGRRGGRGSCELQRKQHRRR